MEPDVSTPTARKALLALAVEALQAGNDAEVERLAGHLVREVDPSELPPLVTQIGAAWLDSIRDDVPIMTVVIAEDALEEAAKALVTEDLAGALANLEEALAYHPKQGSPDLRLLAFLAGLRLVVGPLAVEPEPEAVEEEPLPEPEPEPVQAEAPAPPRPAPMPSSPDWVERGFETLPHSLPQALTCFERAIDRTPELPEAWRGLGLVLAGLGRHEEAIPALEHVLKVLPFDAPAWAAYGEVLAILGREAAATYARTRALELDPAVVAWLPAPAGPSYEDALAAYKAGRFQEGLQLLSQAGETSQRATWLRASSLLGLGQAQEALKLFAALPDTYDDVWIDRGLCLDRLARPAEARGCYERGNPASPRRWCHLARHDAAHAREYFARALEGFQALAQRGPLDHRVAAELAFARQRHAALSAGA